MRKFIVLAILGLILVSSVFVLRFVVGGSEDTWICTGNEWVKHGNPTNPKPTTNCGEDKVTNKTVSEKIAEALSKKYNRPIDSFILETKIDTGLFAKGTVNFKDEMGGGGLWFAAKVDNNWELAFDGNGLMDCSIVNKYNFPSDIVSGCVDSQNGNAFVQR